MGGPCEALPAVMRERAVGLGHPVRIFTFLDGVPPVVRCVEQLGREPLRHRLFVALARGNNQPANTQCLAAVRAHLDRHLIGRAADAAGTHLDRGHDVVERLLEHGERILFGLAFDKVEGTVDDVLGDRFLALVHDRVHEFGHHYVPEFRIGQNLALLGTVTTGHRSDSALFRTLGAVLGPALLAVLDALRVEHAAQDVIAHTGQVLDAAAADHDDRVLLQIVTLARDVADHLEAVGEAYLRDLAQRRVRLFRRRRVDARAHPAFLRALLHRGYFLARLLDDPRLADQLVDRRHLALTSLTARYCAAFVSAGAKSPIALPRARPVRDVLTRNTKSRHPDLDDAVIKQRIAPSKPHAIVHPEKTAPRQGQRQRLSFISQAS